MADLRQRKSHESTTPKKSSTVHPTETPASVTVSSGSRTRHLPVLLTAAVVSAVALVFSQSQTGINFFNQVQIHFTQNGTGFASYALCSRDGRNIYTVDDKNSQVQCLIVRGTDIVATGEWCMWPTFKEHGQAHTVQRD